MANQPSDDSKTSGPWNCSNSALVVPIPPQKRIQVHVAKAAYASRHLALKRLPAHLAIRYDLETDRLLQRNYPINRAIFYFTESFQADPSRRELLLRRKQLSGPEQTPYDIRMEVNHLSLHVVS